LRGKINSENIKFNPNAPSHFSQKQNNIAKSNNQRGSTCEKIVNLNQRCKSNENFPNGVQHKAPIYQDNCSKYK